MSRPHDGHCLSSFFGNPFRIVIRKRSLSFNSKHNQILKAFEAVSTDRLKLLQLKKPKGFINLAWLDQAMQMLCATHKDLRSLIADLQFPLTKRDEKWMDEYLDDTVKLLGIFYSLNAEIIQLEHFQLSVKYVLRLLDFSGGVPPSDKLFRAKGALQDLTGETKTKAKSAESQTISKAERSADILQGMTKSLHLGKMKSSGNGKVLLRAMYGVKVITVFVCSILKSALSGSSHSFVKLHVPDRLLWSASFMSFHQEIHGDIKSGLSKAPVLKEFEGLNAAVKSVHTMIQVSCLDQLEGKESKAVHTPEGWEEMVQIREGVQELRHRAELFSKCLNSLTKQVNDFFQIVLDGRTALLDVSEGRKRLNQWSLSEREIAC